MEVLTDNSFYEAGYKCIGISGYKVGIAFKTHMLMKYRARLEGIPPYSDRLMFFGQEVQIHETPSAIDIVFPNKSRITLFAAKENSRGNRFHEVIYQEGIDEQLVQNVLYYLERLNATTSFTTPEEPEDYDLGDLDDLWFG